MLRTGIRATAKCLRSNGLGTVRASALRPTLREQKLMGLSSRPAFFSSQAGVVSLIHSASPPPPPLPPPSLLVSFSPSPARIAPLPQIKRDVTNIRLSAIGSKRCLSLGKHRQLYRRDVPLVEEGSIFRPHLVASLL
jgi:hypothetical protein